MLAWPNDLEWRRDNRWQDIATAPDGATVDIWAVRWVGFPEHRSTCRRFHGCTVSAGEVHGLPEGDGWRPTHWTVPLPERRRIALTVTATGSRHRVA